MNLPTFCRSTLKFWGKNVIQMCKPPFLLTSSVNFRSAPRPAILVEIITFPWLMGFLMTDESCSVLYIKMSDFWNLNVSKTFSSFSATIIDSVIIRHARLFSNFLMQDL